MPPDALGTTHDRTTVSVSSLHGKVVVVSFGVTRCGSCMKELPVLASLQTLATERGLPLQAVRINPQEDRQTCVRTVRALRPRLPGLLMARDRDGTTGGGCRSRLTGDFRRGAALRANRTEVNLAAGHSAG